MKRVYKIYMLCFSLFCLGAKAQSDSLKKSNAGWFSLGVRSTVSGFSGEGLGFGSGGQFRIQLANQVNTEWFGDYITVSIDDKVRSDYYHIGWSVMFYPMKEAKKIQPYILAGHCFDYNKVTIINSPDLSLDRWGSAVQAGAAMHFNITDRFDLTLISQYMIHLSTILEVESGPGYLTVYEKQNTTLHGHLLTTLSLNYKVGKLWKR